MIKIARSVMMILTLIPMLVLGDIWVHGDSVGVNMKGYGELEVWGPVIPGDSTKQIDRITLLVGTSLSSVFDYNEDADNDISQMLIAEPSLSDMEGFASINNYYSDLPPDIHAAISPYAWTDEEYLIIKVIVTNIGAEAFDARIGLDIISQIAGDYDGVHTWLPESNIIDMSREGENHLGLKFLSHPMTSLSQFVWFSGYSAAGQDGALWSWMTARDIDTVAVCTNPDDGVVSIPSSAVIRMDPDVGIPFFYCIARGQTEATMLENIAAAEIAYSTIFTVGVDEFSAVPETSTLSQNYPNPFNPSTEINFNLVTSGEMSLDVFNLRGEHVLNLQNGWMASGDYSVSFTNATLPSGLYIYRLTSGSTQLQKKMTLLK
ncbi:MAG: T9SS type A sorting domain-containing protein [Candidatus Marinimicrobia bacterium]|nr:T9SS type A sorting domain-containing protein [Candidatus Neomarinimicrobiota bacterium]